MKFLLIAFRNAARNKGRLALTILGVAVAIVAFVMIRTVVGAWEVGAKYAAQDRIGTRHKVSFVMSLPQRYVDTIRNTPGVKDATWANWFGAKWPADEREFFATLAVDPPSFLRVYDETSLSDAERQAWFEDRQGAIVGDILANKLGMKLGDKVTLKGTIYPGDWTFNIRGIYKATRKSLDRSQFLFHYAYMNEAIPESRRDMIGWIVSRIDSPTKSASISKKIDAIFDSQDRQTITMSESALNASFLGMFSAILSALDIVSVVIMLILVLILGNTIAMGVRERTNEYGVLRAVGFLPSHVRLFVLGESSFVGFMAGVLGLVLAYPIVELGMGRWLEENMGSMFPYFRIEPATAVAALVLASCLGLAGGLVPAVQAGRLKIVDALRRVD